MREVAIVGAVRTAIGKFGGALKDISSIELGSLLIKEVLERTGVAPREVEEVILGNVYQAGLGQNPARQAALKAGLPVETPAVTINKLCASGLKAVTLAVQAISTGDAEIIVAGGMENMSQAPYVLAGARFGLHMGHSQVVDTLIKDGLWCAFSEVHMGVTAEYVAAKYNISREAQDEFAFLSQERAIKAIDSGRFKAEILPVPVPEGKGKYRLFDEDEFPRRNTTPERLAQLKPAFQEGGTVTAGNASGINDGAACLLIMAAEKAAAKGLKPLALIKGYASAGVHPRFMGLGTIPAAAKAMQKAGLTAADLDIAELNEAFAAQSLVVLDRLGLAKNIVNVNGGAIALGHPIGASGARILVTLLHEMAKRNSRHGLAALCVGGGQGVAVVVER